MTGIPFFMPMFFNIISKKKYVFLTFAVATNHFETMKVQELVDTLNLKGNAYEGNIWITLQIHKNVMAVASLKELSCIILVKNLVPNNDTIEQSNEEGLPLLQTDLPTYEIAGLVYNLLH